MTKDELALKIKAIKKQKKLTWKQIAEAVGDGHFQVAGGFHEINAAFGDCARTGCPGIEPRSLIPEATALGVEELGAVGTGVIECRVDA